MTQLQGGSGGASGIGLNSAGGFASTGGGALELGAVDAIIVHAGGIVEANGIAGSGAAFAASGSGSSGGIFLHAPTVTNDGTVSAGGGTGGDGGWCGGGLLEVFYKYMSGTGSYAADGGTAGSGSGTAATDGSVGKVKFQQNKNITASLTGSGEILLTGDTAVTSLAVTYDASSGTYTFTATSGVTFGADASLAGSVTFTPNGNTATLAPNGTTWAALGYSVGTNLTTATGTAVTLGGGGAPASNFVTPFAVANSSGGTTALTVDDSDDGKAPSIGMSATQLSFSGGPTFDYAAADLAGLTLVAGSGGSSTVTVTGTPAAVTPTLARGRGRAIRSTWAVDRAPSA